MSLILSLPRAQLLNRGADHTAERVVVLLGVVLGVGRVKWVEVVEAVWIV